MSFPPNLGITNSFIMDSTCTCIFQELPSLLPHLDHISSPFSKHRINGYSRIKKPNTNRSKSLDFSDLSLARTPPKLTPRRAPPPLHDSIPEHEHDSISGPSAPAQKETSTPSLDDKSNDAVIKKSISIKRSASVSEGYSRIHSVPFIPQTTSVKKKSKFFRAFKRLLGL